MNETLNEVWVSRKKYPPPKSGFKFSSPLISLCYDCQTLWISLLGKNPWLSMTFSSFFVSFKSLLTKQQSHTNYFCDDQNLYFCNSIIAHIILFSSSIEKKLKILFQKKKNHKKHLKKRGRRTKLEYCDTFLSWHQISLYPILNFDWTSINALINTPKLSWSGSS